MVARKEVLQTDPRATITDTDFVSLFERLGATRLAKKIGQTESRVYQRRRRLERIIKREICTPTIGKNATRRGIAHPHRLHWDILNGHVIIGSDGHYWDGPPSCAHRGFVYFAKELQPKALILNGDAMDGARISRHPPINWEDRPEVEEEIEAIKIRLGEVEEVVPRNCKLSWNLGNHDSRFETRLATQAPEYARIHGFHLKDHFGRRWEPAWSTWINNEVVVKHRLSGGRHATTNNVLRSGLTTITGHLHSLQVRPFSDYSPRPKWGCDSGMLANPYGPQFVHYTEDNPVDWRAGFLVLTFHNGVLLWPEVVAVFDDDHVEFRGRLIKV